MDAIPLAYVVGHEPLEETEAKMRRLGVAEEWARTAVEWESRRRWEATDAEDAAIRRYEAMHR